MTANDLVTARVVDVFSAVARTPDADLATTEPGDGYSGRRVLELLSRLGERLVRPDAAYVEVGVYRGLTLGTVAGRVDGPCIGIDDFSLFNADGDNAERVRSRIAGLGLENVTVVDADMEVALADLPATFPGLRIGLLFVDAAHDHRSQLMALHLARPHMGPRSAIVVDDANYAHVRQATRDFLATDPGFALVGEALTLQHPDNAPDPGQHRRGWWNGVQVLARTEPGDGSGLVPDPEPLDRHRSTHDLFRHLLADRAHEALELCVQLADADAADREDLVARIGALVATERARPGRHAHQNVDTAGREAVRTAE